MSTRSARIVRLGRALLSAPRTVRELVDIIPSNNPAAYVDRLRRQGLAIPCERIEFITVDGERSWYGLYSATDEDRQKLQQLVHAPQRSGQGHA